MTAKQREPNAEYEICRECAETGATIKGNDGWMRHEECARERNEWPHVEHAGVNEVLGASVRVYEGGAVSVTASLRHITASLGVKQLAHRLGETGVDFGHLHPTREFLANGEEELIES